MAVVQAQLQAKSEECEGLAKELVSLRSEAEAADAKHQKTAEIMHSALRDTEALKAQLADALAAAEAARRDSELTTVELEACLQDCKTLEGETSELSEQRRALEEEVAAVRSRLQETNQEKDLLAQSLEKVRAPGWMGPLDLHFFHRCSVDVQPFFTGREGKDGPRV